MLFGSCRIIKALSKAQWTVLLALIFGYSSFALAEEPVYFNEDRTIVGVNARYFSGLYFGQDGYLEAEPYFDIRYGALFAEGQTLGLDIAKSERASLAIAVTRGNHFLDPDDINDEQAELYLGIEERERAIEAGFVYKYQSRVGLVSFTYFQDVSSTHEAQRGSVRIARPIPNEGGIAFTPSLFVKYYSAAFNRYYFGVSPEDNNAGIIERYGVITDTTRENFEALRQEYQPDNSAHFGFDLDMRMPLSDNLILSGYFAYEEVTGPQYRSPLVEDRKQYTSKLGLSYLF
jgi:outer membrane scaffolding protein for murein synthesis (MipA/OmpV family)